MSKNFEINKNDIDMIIKACKENGIILDPNVKSDKLLLLDFTFGSKIIPFSLHAFIIISMSFLLISKFLLI